MRDDGQACCGGMLFGMDSGIIGGVLTMDPFQKSVLRAMSGGYMN